MTLVELMVALAIGLFLMIGAIQVYNQSRQAFVINESIARVQETAQFAMDTVEADLRMASNWGRHSRGSAVNGRSLVGDLNPLALPAPAICGADWALDLAQPLVGSNNAYTLPCIATGAHRPIPTLLRHVERPSPCLRSMPADCRCRRPGFKANCLLMAMFRQVSIRCVRKRTIS